MKKFTYTLIAILLLIGLFFLQRYQNTEISNNNIEAASNTTQLSRDSFLPKSNHQIVHHKSYSLSYNEMHEQADWTVHILNDNDIKNVDFKRPYFEIDDMVQTGAADWKNYKKSGYDRGHLVPAGDRRSSFEDYNETFLTSNISPQEHNFNAGVWNRIEQKIRYYVKKNGPIYVVTGSVFQNDLGSIGYENVTIPSAFYKILLTKDGSNYKALAFLVPHQETDAAIYKFITSIDTIEALTGNDFFYQLPDDIEENLERIATNKGW